MPDTPKDVARRQPQSPSGVHGFFWPVFVIAGWGIGLVMNAWNVYWRHEITEEDIQREMER